VSRCGVGQVIYTAWCDDQGKVIDDGTLAHVGANRFRMTAAIPNLYWLEENAGGLDVEIEDVSDAIAGLALQGPTSRDMLQQLTNADLRGLGYFRCTEDSVAGAPALITRTGYTGDLGYEIFVDREVAEPLWDALMEIRRDFKMRPAGGVALDLARIEAGLLLIEADFTSSKQTMFEVQKMSPYDLGLGWMVDLGKDFFVGQQALRREKERGSRWATVGIELDVTGLEKAYAQFDMPLQLPARPWNGAVPIYADAAQRHHIGRGNSGTWSPLLKKYIVIARVEAKYGERGTRFFIEEMVEAKSFSIPATVVQMPFYDPPHKKA
ncbi:MAG: aminomethyltransferase family protein, partial [Myxococcales bacterium]|nr:aminomethyltransferase family protein [Myxococcales bacterium]